MFPGKNYEFMHEAAVAEVALSSTILSLQSDTNKKPTIGTTNIYIVAQLVHI